VKYFTVSATAEMFSCAPKTIRKLIHDGKLNAVKLGNDYRISQDDIAKFIELNETKPKVSEEDNVEAKE
jgi:excisionase family DNA binding protein